MVRIGSEEVMCQEQTAGSYWQTTSDGTSRLIEPDRNVDFQHAKKEPSTHDTQHFVYYQWKQDGKLRFATLSTNSETIFIDPAIDFSQNVDLLVRICGKPAIKLVGILFQGDVLVATTIKKSCNVPSSKGGYPELLVLHGVDKLMKAQRIIKILLRRDYIDKRCRRHRRRLRQVVEAEPLQFWIKGRIDHFVHTNESRIAQYIVRKISREACALLFAERLGLRSKNPALVGNEVGKLPCDVLDLRWI
jgi:hypothetical protein